VREGSFAFPNGRPKPAGRKRMCFVFRFESVYRVEVELEVRLNFQLGRLADLVQILAHSDALITNLDPDRSHYALGMGEATTRVKFRVRDTRHRERVFKAIREQNLRFEMISN
jgi:(p)ppGpp synthase/HD superfamily hydrolase